MCDSYGLWSRNPHLWLSGCFKSSFVVNTLETKRLSEGCATFEALSEQFGNWSWPCFYSSQVCWPLAADSSYSCCLATAAAKAFCFSSPHTWSPMSGTLLQIMASVLSEIRSGSHFKGYCFHWIVWRTASSPPNILWTSTYLLAIDQARK